MHSLLTCQCGHSSDTGVTQGAGWLPASFAIPSAAPVDASLVSCLRGPHPQIFHRAAEQPKLCPCQPHRYWECGRGIGGRAVKLTGDWDG